MIQYSARSVNPISPEGECVGRNNPPCDEHRRSGTLIGREQDWLAGMVARLCSLSNFIY